MCLASRPASSSLNSNTSAALSLLHLSRISVLLSLHCVIVLWSSLCRYTRSEASCFSSSLICCSVRCLQRPQALCRWHRSSCRIAWEQRGICQYVIRSCALKSTICLCFHLRLTYHPLGKCLLLVLLWLSPPGVKRPCVLTLPDDTAIKEIMTRQQTGQLCCWVWKLITADTQTGVITHWLYTSALCPLCLWSLLRRVNSTHELKRRGNARPANQMSARCSSSCRKTWCFGVCNQTTCRN